MSHPNRPWSPARPTCWRGIQMRSRLEAGFAQWADSQGLGPEYEPVAFAGYEGQYLPDFRLNYVEVEGLRRDYARQGVVWVEVKPVLPMGELLVQLQARIEVIDLSEPEPVLAIAYKDPQPGLIVRARYRRWRPAVWTRGNAPYNIGIAFPLTEPEDLPWPDGYWQGPEPDEVN